MLNEINDQSSARVDWGLSSDELERVREMVLSTVGELFSSTDSDEMAARGIALLRAFEMIGGTLKEAFLLKMGVDLGPGAYPGETPGDIPAALKDAVEILSP